MKRWWILLLLGPWIGLSAQTRKVDLKALDKYFEKSRQDMDVPGLAIAIVKDDAVVFSKGYGTRTIGKNEPVDDHTMFAIASISKAFTVALLGRLVDEGRLSWDDPVTRYVPYFQMYDPWVTREMKIRDLLCHRSGSKTFGGDLIWYGTDYSRKEVVERVRYLKPTYSFRSTYGYQNIMFITAGEIFPAVVGKSWDDLVKEQIFEPLGMKETNTSVRFLEGQTNVATPHTLHQGALITIPYRNVDNAGADAAINSNVHDMALWIRAWLKPDSTFTLVRPATRHEIWTPHQILPVSMSSAKRIPSTHFRAAALGWFTADYKGRKILEHGGGMDGMISKICIVPEERLGMILLTNSISGLATALMYQILDAYLGGDARDWVKETTELAKKLDEHEKAERAKREAARVKETRPSLPLEHFTGVYGGPMYGDVRVDIENGQLVVRFLRTASFVGDLRHWHFDTWEIELRDPTLPTGWVTFRLHASGEVEDMVIDIPNPDFDFTELELRKKTK